MDKLEKQLDDLLRQARELRKQGKHKEAHELDKKADKIAKQLGI